MVRLLVGYWAGFLLPVALVVFVHSACSVNQFLFPGIERVAVVTDLHLQIPDCGTGLKSVAASTGNGGDVIIRVYVLLHC